MEGTNVVVDELIEDPSMVAPTLFVGLGGCGSQTVMRVARHLHKQPDFDEKYKDLVKFAIVDTNINDLETHRQHADESFLISDFEKEEYSDFASGQKFLEEDDYFTQWVPKDYRFRAGDTAGAGQIRIESRLGCYYQMKHKGFVPRFRRMLEDLKSHEHGHRRIDDDAIRIVICFSVAGGTGSGSFLPLAYMLRDQAAALGRPQMLGVSVLPAVFEDKTGANKDGTFANGYAAIKELEHLMKLGAPESRFFPEDGREFHYDPSDESKTHVRHKPFDFVYMIDKPEAFSVDNVVDAAADGLYLQLFSPLFNEQASDYDNYTQHQRFLVPHDFEAKGIVGYTQFYASYGAAVMLVPVAGLVDYCARAAALNLIEANFLGDIPADPTYETLRANRAEFDQIKASDEDDAPIVDISDFHKKPEGRRKQLRDRLFKKRVRLLARCELNEQKPDRFVQIFRHGHRLGAIPAVNGEVDEDPDQVQRQREQLADRGPNYSLGALILDSLIGDNPRRPSPGLLKAARRAMGRARDEQASRVNAIKKEPVSFWKSRANRWVEELKNAGRQILKEGYNKQQIHYPGLDELSDLQFIEDAEDVDMSMQRYAALNILDEFSSDLSEPEPWSGFELVDWNDDDVLKKEDDVKHVIEELYDQAIDGAFTALKREFLEQRMKIREQLQDHAQEIRGLEHGFDDFQREQLKQLRRFREEGDDSANQFVLDTEALQIENGRRLWDFYFEDRIADMQELSLSNPEVRKRLSTTLRSLSISNKAATSSGRKKLLDTLEEYATERLEAKIGGDHKAEDEADRYGLTLSDALRLEIEYRALYQSNREEIENKGRRAIRNLIGQYRAKPREEQLDIDDPRHQDYLRDKAERTVKEKADLLVSYDDSRDQHGGVRPAKNLLGCISENFSNDFIKNAIQQINIEGEVDWVTEGWTDPQKIIFYQSVLNVPPYVFGRMDEMKDYYYRFKNLAKRSKVLHIDKNWEESLPDLDPASAQEKHRQEKVRQHIINFGVLLTLQDPVRDHEGFIIHRDGTYFLRPPVPDSKRSDGEEESGDLAPLGDTLAEAIEHLPEVLEGEKVKYLHFQQVLKAVRNGLAPRVLGKVVELPIKWRENRDELRTQYGSSPTPQQKLLLKDYTDSFKRMHEALEALLDELRNKQTEQMVVGGEPSADGIGLDSEQARENLAQSIDLLRGFLESWHAMENPEESNSVPSTFSSIFQSMTERELNGQLDKLRNGHVDEEDFDEARRQGASALATDEE